MCSTSCRISTWGLRQRDVRGVVYGHSHKPSIEHRAGVLYLNPGSAGPRRFKLPVTVARMSVVNGELTAQIIELDIAQA